MEYLDIVNDNDEVIGRQKREALYDKFPTHRIVHVLVFNRAGEMALQLRSQNVSFLPGYWSTSAGGHVISGETYEEAAKRELKEELGLEVPFKFAYKDLYQDKRGNKKLLSTYTVTFDGESVADNEDVEKVEFFSMEKIKDMIANKGKFHPELLFLIKKHY
ncbi:NUDIX domain-containing protein [Patescibacteria group bacterium]|nr:NUDIX domain-containing protein [Patescibacteria group bacterium]MBU1891036.1 NUDIX domain-containing protein [Patescibacteria group bacterium]